VRTEMQEMEVQGVTPSSKEVGTSEYEAIMALANKKNPLGFTSPSKLSVALHLLHAGKDGEIDADEINYITEGLKQLWDVVLLVATLIFSLVLPFCFTDGVLEADGLWSARTVSVLQTVFTISIFCCAAFFLVILCICSTLYFNMLLQVTTADKVWFLQIVANTSFNKFLYFGIFFLFVAVVAGGMLAHGVDGVIGAAVCFAIMAFTVTKPAITVPSAVSAQLRRTKEEVVKRASPT